MQPDISRPVATDRHIWTDPVDKILAAYRVSGPWQRLEATGVANLIYALLMPGRSRSQQRSHERLVS
jgi:hypothetical protein